MRLIGRIASATLVIAVLAPGASAGEAGDAAAQTIERLGERAIAVLQDDELSAGQQNARLRAILRQGLDLEAIGSFVLGRHGRQAGAEQRRTFQRLFADYVVDTYAQMLRRRQVTQFEVTESETRDDSTALVATRVSEPGQGPMTWQWVLHREEGSWRVVDLRTQGVSLAVTYRSEFGAVIDSQGMDALIERLRRRAQRSPDLDRRLAIAPMLGKMLEEQGLHSLRMR